MLCFCVFLSLFLVVVGFSFSRFLAVFGFAFIWVNALLSLLLFLGAFVILSAVTLTTASVKVGHMTGDTAIKILGITSCM